MEDSIARANAPQPPKLDPQTQKADSTRRDSMDKLAKEGTLFKGASGGTEQTVYVSNDVFTVAFSTKGGQPKWVELKKFKNMDSGHVRLAAAPHNGISYSINTGTNSHAESR